jgi:hypothetical protein
MKQKPGPPKGVRFGGRQKGTVNKVNKDLQAGIRELLEGLQPKVAGWIERVSKTDPAKAFELYMKFHQYCIPMLNKSDVGIGNQIENKPFILELTMPAHQNGNGNGHGK